MSAKSAFRSTCFFLVLALVLSALPAPTAAVDAELEGQPDSLAFGEEEGASAPQEAKMHWPQEPDLSPNGLDVAMSEAPLADDFLCTESGPILHIRIWTSFFHDELPPEGPGSVTFLLSIYANIPAGQQADWSMPGDRLWSQEFLPGEYEVSQVASDIPEGWYDPLQELWEPENHLQVFQYDFFVREEPFSQEQDTIYWLSATADYPLIGWKTTALELRYEDDAAIWRGPEPLDWMELRYPEIAPPHPYAPESLDLAFAIFGGLEELDFGDAMDPSYPTLLANDGARHIIDGVTFLGAGVDPEPDGQPDPAAIGDDHDIAYPPPNDDEDGVLFTSAMIPGQPATVDVIAAVPGLLNAWCDFNIDGDWDEADEQIFIDQALVAGVNNLTFNVPAAAMVGETLARFRFDTVGGLKYMGLADDGEVEDYRVYIQEPVEGFKMHHPQYPDLSFTGIDVALRPGTPLADDFECTYTGAINHIRIWVSFAEDKLPPEGPGSLILELAIHENIPADAQADWSMPGEVLWRRLFGPGEYSVTQIADNMPEWWYDPATGLAQPDSHFQAFQYDFVIEEEPFLQEAGKIYWLAVVEIEPMGDYALGWKTTPIALHFEDDATWFHEELNWQPLAYPEGHPYYPETLDLAFVIFGAPVEREYGDAPEGSTAIAYPASGVTGAFPTCRSTGPAGWVEHNNFGAWLGPSFDFEPDGNAGLCPGCFPPYDQDECFADGDAGLILPEPFTIVVPPTGGLNVVPCPNSVGTALGTTCQMAMWGVDVDIDVTNLMPSGTDGYVNVLVDWDQNGAWGGSSPCPTAAAPEHVLVDFAVPNGFAGPLSALMPPGFLIGPNPGFVWARFSISEQPVGPDWNGEAVFEDGESEDYLLQVLAPPPPEVQVIKTLVEPVDGVAVVSDTITYTIRIHNSGGTSINTMPLYDYYCPSCLELTSWSMDWTEHDATLGVIYWADVLNPAMGGPGILLPSESTTITVDFHAHLSHAMYWKESGWLDYAPKGMPDFDQKQDMWGHEPVGAAMIWSYCGPVAAANSLWWFDSKFEPSPIPPPVINDGYPLVPSYHASWDDHDSRNVDRLVTTLAPLMGTSPVTGTNVHNLAAGIAQHINNQGLAGQYTVHREPRPTFEWVEKEVRRSEDVILLLGFWQEQPSGSFERIGGHYVTVAGIDSENKKIAFSDPYYDRAEQGVPWEGRVLPNPHSGLHPTPGPISDTTHNDAKYASHDVYDWAQSPSPGGTWGPQRYATECYDVLNFQGQNTGDHANTAPCELNLPIFTEVEYAVAVSPITISVACRPTDNMAVVSGAMDVAGNEVPEAQGHAQVTVKHKKHLRNDRDGDGRSDLAIYGTSSGDWWILESAANWTTWFFRGGWGAPGYVPVSGDYDGDGKLDLAVYGTTTGDWWILYSGTNYTTWFNRAGWGGTGYDPVEGDYDGDGKWDLAVYDTATGDWWILESGSGFTTWFHRAGWGAPGYQPVPGDYDGDGRWDLAVYGTTTGDWWILYSSTSFTTWFHRAGWGAAGYTPVQGDYDGDGRWDLAVYHDSTGDWWILESSSLYTTWFYRAGWGAPGYVPVPGDYDGDGRWDLAVHQDSTGDWWILESHLSYSTWFYRAGWGAPGYIPV